MFLHIGKNFTIPVTEIVAIIDKDSSLISKDTKKFIEKAKNDGCLYRIDGKEAKTYIITSKKVLDKKTGKKYKKNIVFTSSISSSTLFKRNDYMKESILQIS